MKKGRHRRYEEARKFQRENAAAFSVEDFDFDEPDLFSKEEDDAPDDQYGDLAEKLAEKDMDEIVEIFDYLYKRSFDREDTSTVIREKLVGNDDLPSTILDLLIECGDIDIKRIIGERI